MQDDQVTGVSRSGRVRKKSSKLMDFESPDDIETRYRRNPVKAFNHNVNQFRSEEQDYDAQQHVPAHPMEEGGTASSESDYYENNGEAVDSGESDSSMEPLEPSEAGAPGARGPASSLYLLERGAKKKMVIKDGRLVARVKAQRKDKGKTRITAYMMWSKEARNDLLRKHPEMDFSAVSKRLGEMWANVNYNERYLWKRKAKRFAMQKESRTTPNKIISNSKPRYGQVGRPPTQRAQKLTSPPGSALVPSSSSSPAPLTVTSGGSAAARGAGGAPGAAELAAHLRLLGESLAIIGERLQEHEGQIAVSGSVSVLLDTLLCALAPLLGALGALPAPRGHAAGVAPPPALVRDTLHNVAYIMPGL